ncbi:MAG TPA: hypothetical protein VMS60_10090 [Solirubrobacterales bacterium]|nr:hypothetical protein [Solirubrobacterales bacterium]
MSTRVPVEDIEVSAGEKVLSVVLAVFISVGAIWAYVRVDDLGAEDGVVVVRATPSERAAIDAHQAAMRARFDAGRDVRAAQHKVEFTREAYRTALDAGQSSAALQQDYVAAQETLDNAEGRVDAARATADETAPAAERAETHRSQELRSDQAGHDRWTFVLRLALLATMLGSAYYLLGRLRRRRSRYLPAIYAWIGASGVLALVMAGDYTGNYVEFSEAGPLAISLAGIALTLAAFVALQRYLARRVPARRVRKGECPFCGFPARGGRHCEGCGRLVVSECSRCREPRRVGTEHCAACGKA